MEISAKDIAALRAKTGVSMMQCKAALEEAQGDEAKAIDILRSKGAAQAVKKGDRAQGEGYIFAASNANKAVMVLVRCETDFVARNDDFQALGAKIAADALQNGAADVQARNTDGINAAIQGLGENISIAEAKEVSGTTIGTYVHTNGKVGVLIALNGGTEDQARDTAMHAAALRPEFISPDEVSTEAIAKEKTIWTEQLASEGKPAEILEKIMMGKEKKFREENALLTQAFVKNPDQTIATYLQGSTVTAYSLMTV